MANKAKLQYAGQYRVTVPKGLVLAKGWGKGDKLVFSLTKQGDILLKPMNGKKLVKKATLQFLNNTQFMLTLPKEIVMAKRWKAGDIVEFVFDENTDLLLRKMVIK